MTKDEKIKEDWGDMYPKLKTSNNGWSIGIFNIDMINLNFFDTLETKYGFKVRPKSLQGIEDNNGWIKIESEDDLPKEKGCYHVINKKGRYFRKNFLKHLNNHQEKWKSITHYQPIEKPKPPIY